MEKGANVQLMLNFAFDIRKPDITNLCISSIIWKKMCVFIL